MGRINFFRIIRPMSRAVGATQLATQPEASALDPQDQELLLQAAAPDAHLHVAHANLQGAAALLEEDLVALLEAVVAFQRGQELVLALGEGVRLVDLDLHSPMSPLPNAGGPTHPPLGLGSGCP